jgi:hypothetical protein
MKPTKYRKGKLVRHIREPDSLGLIMEIVRNFPIGNKLTPATYQIYWSAGSDKHQSPEECWYSEAELEGVN